ncbi:MAG: FAD-dependent oxidoreductase [Deinococcota bacterium]
MTADKTTLNYTASVPILDSCDVLVIGGGSAGSSAAVAAAGTGAKVILVERYGFLGGTGAMVLDTFYGFFTPQVERKVVGGIPDRVIDILKARNVLIKRPNTYGAGAGYTYDPESLKAVWDELVQDAGVHLLLHSYFVDALTDGARVTGALIGTKQGLKAIHAKTVVDASGDADVVARAGGPFEDAGAMGTAQSLTTTFKMINVDVEAAKAFPKKEMWQKMADASASGDYNLPRKEGSSHITPHEGVMVTNMTRVAGVDPTDPAALAKAEQEGRKQAFEYARFLHDQVPGYEHSILGGLSIQIGVRESRRVRGEYWLTREDVLAARKFDDAIAQCGAPIEEHHAGGDTRWEYLPAGETYDIPFRCLVPQGLISLVVAGRCLSASHDAHASVRSIGQCLAMGQAAGLAAALSSQQNCADVRDLDTDVLRTQLKDLGAVL